MIAGTLVAGEASQAQQSDGTLAFRGYLQGYANTDNEVFWNFDYWAAVADTLAAEGFTAIVWYGPNELTNGQHMLVRHDEFPEARELTPERNDSIIDLWQRIFDHARTQGLENYLMTQHIFFTRAFADEHGLLNPGPNSPTVSHWQERGYPNFWPGDPAPIHNCCVRTELTRAYTEAVYVELIDTYQSLDGFWGFSGEPVPGNRSTFYRDAILPGLQRASRPMKFVANQWQIPLNEFVENILGSDSSGNLWLGFHGFNSEQITDSKPYPGVLLWSEVTGLPTIPEVYPANQLFFPFNSPKFAHEIVSSIASNTGLAGYLYYERHISGRILGPLFRQALAAYGRDLVPYSPDPWIRQLAELTGNRQAAHHLLNAYDACTRVIPETTALVYSGGDVMRRELRMPYEFFAEPFPWSYVTSPARGGRLVPIRHYASMIARDRERFASNGSDPSVAPFYQHPVWGSEGGSIYDVTPIEHMARVVEIGASCQTQADSAYALATSGSEALAETRDVMEGVYRLSQYYEKKVAAAIASLVFAESADSTDLATAERAADEALDAYIWAAEFMHERLDPYYQRISGGPLNEAGVLIPDLIEAERRDRAEIGQIFGWR